MKNLKCPSPNSSFKISFLTLALVLSLTACNDRDDFSLPELQGLSLYWDHFVFGEEGRRFRFSFTATQQFDEQHQLIFEPSVRNNVITFNMVGSINKGVCQRFPMPSILPDDPNRCRAEGRTFITEDQLPPGTYIVNIVTPFFRESAELIIGQEKSELKINPNPHFSSAIPEVYPLPKNILFGAVVDSGAEKLDIGRAFIKELENLGLAPATLPPSPYRHLMIDENGQPLEKFWDSGEFSLGILHHLLVDFEQVVELATRYFKETGINISISTSNGDEGFFRPQTGIRVVYAGK